MLAVPKSMPMSMPMLILLIFVFQTKAKGPERQGLGLLAKAFGAARKCLARTCFLRFAHAQKRISI
jgi:hypothetical protein